VNIQRLMATMLSRLRDNRCPRVRGSAARTYLIEVRDGRVVHIVNRAEFNILVAERFFRDGATWRGYWEERFRRVYPRRKR
jgi:hypothetical protein